MLGSSIASGLTIGKVISGISKTLGIVNQAIPIYREVKPMISNAKSMLSIIKDINSPSVSKPAKSVSNDTVITNKKVKPDNSTLTFFQ